MYAGSAPSQNNKPFYSYRYVCILHNNNDDSNAYYYRNQWIKSKYIILLFIIVTLVAFVYRPHSI